MAEENLKKKTRSGLYWTFFNQLSNYGMAFVIGIFMARMLSPEDYGITALPGVFYAIARILMDSGFVKAMIRKPELTEKDLSTAFYYNIIVGVICYILLFCASPFIADFYNTPILKSLIRVTAITFLWSPLRTPQFILLNRRIDFKTPTKIGIVCQLLAGIIGISMAFYGYGLWSLIVSDLISNIIGTFMIWYAVRWIPKTGWSKESFKYLWGYGNKLLASSLLDTIYNNITPIFIGKYYSPSDLGVYNRANTYASLPSSNITLTISSVTFPVLSKLQNDDEALARNYRKMLKVCCFVIFPLMMLIAGLAHPIVITMVTAKWEACVVLLQILCFALMWYPVHAINLNLLQVKGRSDLFLRLEIVKKVVGVTILCITLPMGLLFFCYGQIVSSIISLIINTYYTGKLINCGFIRQMKDLAPTLMLSIVLFVINLTIVNFIPNMIIQLVLGISLSAIIYISVAYLFRFSELEDALYLVKKNQ